MGPGVAAGRNLGEIDMRASPSDLRALGFAPIAIETPAGRAEYEQHQRAFATRSEPLRASCSASATRRCGGAGTVAAAPARNAADDATPYALAPAADEVRVLFLLQQRVETAERGQLTVPFADIQEIKLNPKSRLHVRRPGAKY